MLLAAFVCGLQPWASADHDWQPLPAKVSLMVVGAHLDDEGIYFGGTMPYYAGVLGLPTVHIAMTSGDSSVPTVTREEESRECDWAYGLRNEPIFARFKDWGMGSHSPYTRLQRNWSLWYEPDPGPAYYRPDGTVQTAASPFPTNNPAGEANPAEFDPGRWNVATYLARQIRICKPEVIVTHDLSGEYGHSNHRTTAWGVWDAYYLAADPGVDIDGLPAWQVKKLYHHLFSRATDPIAPDTPLPGTSYPAGSTIINRQYQDWSTPYPELNGKTPLQVANDGIVKYVSIGGTNLLTQFAVRYSEQYGLYASVVGPDTVDSDGWARTSFFEHIEMTTTTTVTTTTTTTTTVARPAITGVQGSGDEFVVQWAATNVGSYQVEATASLAPMSWSNLPGLGPIAGSNGILSATDTNAGLKKFYRVIWTF
jgi:LmbE family N-acetylglucosaminyl deacetylase